MITEIASYPKIFALGTRNVKDIFSDSVQITEKVDGSMFAFGKVGGQLLFRSKGRMIDVANVESLFKPAVEYILSIQNRLPNNTVFYGETLCKPKHNTLKYDRVPKNHIALFGVYEVDLDLWQSKYWVLDEYRKQFEIDAVPLLYEGELNIDIPKYTKDALERESFLGGVPMEGIVIKNYYKQAHIANDIYSPFIQAKFVSESFKEVHRGRWKAEETVGGKWGAFCDGYRTPARWEKAIIHLRERGELTESPQDIGKLIAEVRRDIETEEETEIKDFLYSMYKKDVLTRATNGLPEWYKERLVSDCY